jgi:hypothetical protein
MFSLNQHAAPMPSAQVLFAVESSPFGSTATVHEEEILHQLVDGQFVPL